MNGKIYRYEVRYRDASLTFMYDSMVQALSALADSPAPGYIVEHQYQWYDSEIVIDQRQEVQT